MNTSIQPYKMEKLSVMGRFDRIKYTFLVTIGTISTLLFGLWWFNPEHISQNFIGLSHGFDIVLFAVLSYVVWYQIINELFSWYIAHFMKQPKPTEPEQGLRIAFLTAFVPGKEPFDVLEKTLQAMVDAEYSHDTWVLDEGDSLEAKYLCQRYGVKYFSRKGIAKYNTKNGEFKAKTKAGNYNAWYDKYGKNYDFVAQIDVDFVPKKNFLTKTLGYFKDSEVAFVGSPQIYGNIDASWITKGAAEQAYNFYGSMQKGFFGSDMQLFIGANHVVRVAAHDAIEGYSGHIVEDHLTGMKFYSKRWKSVYVPEVLAVGEGPSTWSAYFSQQMRWAYGLIDILFTQSPKLFLKMRFKHVLNYFLLQQYYFYGFAQVLGVILFSLYFIFGVEATSMELTGLLLFYTPVLIIQQIIFLWLQKFNINPQKESGLMMHGKMLNLAAWPIYFVAFIGVLVRKRLTYKVTPKGSEQKEEAQPKLFIPHFVLGSVATIDIVISFYTHNTSMQLVFWAWVTAVVMFYYFLTEWLKKITFDLETVDIKEVLTAPFKKIQTYLS